jgi:hypothetical protein
MSKQNLQLGFTKSITGGHAARSMIFLEMRALVQALPLDIAKPDFTKAVTIYRLPSRPYEGISTYGKGALLRKGMDKLK